MALPQRTEYSESLQNLRRCVSDDELRAGELATNALGLPLLWSGNFADVYKVHCPQTGNTWAVKCFTRESPGLRERYREISAHSEQAHLPFMVDFQYVEPGLRAGGRWVPFLKMRWVEGQTLNEFVGQRVDQPKLLRQLLALWPKLASRLRAAAVAHGDLQHGNVLLVPASETGKLRLKLVDYDGMFVPALAGRHTGEVGHPCYQHPQRLREALYHADIDRFSHLVIYCALRCLLLKPHALWDRFDNGDNLLFREPDFRQPRESKLFQELWTLEDPDVRALVGHLILATQMPLDHVLLLDELVSGSRVRPLSRDERQQTAAVMEVSAGHVHAVPRFHSPAPGPSQSPVTRPTPPVIEVVEPPVPPPSLGLPTEVIGDRTLTPIRVASGDLAERPAAGILRGIMALLLATIAAGVWAVRKFDGPLRRLVGDDNAVLHNFLRVLAVVCGTGCVACAVWVTVLTIDARRETARARQAAAANALGEAEAAWVTALQEADKSLLAKYAGPQFQAAQVEARLAEASAPEKPEDATGQYRQAVVLLTRAQTEAIPARQRALEESTISNSIGMKLALIPAGEFLMGSPDLAGETGAGEKPQHRVRITKPFYLGMHEVTQGEYEKVMGGNPSQFRGDSSLPVENVSWNDAQGFCEKLSALPDERAVGRVYRLPTEAEWEYACRAGSTTQYSFGDAEAQLDQYAWCGTNSGSKTHPVGQKQPNAWGLYDMPGNVWEWCADWYDKDYYAGSPPDDPTGPSSGSDRVGRGGGWISRPRRCRSSDRIRFSPVYRGIDLGFRVARSPSGQ